MKVKLLNRGDPDVCPPTRSLDRTPILTAETVPAPRQRLLVSRRERTDFPQWHVLQSTLPPSSLRPETVIVTVLWFETTTGSLRVCFVSSHCENPVRRYLVVQGCGRSVEDPSAVGSRSFLVLTLRVQRPVSPPTSVGPSRPEESTHCPSDDRD